MRFEAYAGVESWRGKKQLKDFGKCQIGARRFEIIEMRRAMGLPSAIPGGTMTALARLCGKKR